MNCHRSQHRNHIGKGNRKYLCIALKKCRALDTSNFFYFVFFLYLVLMIIFIYILVACWLLYCSIGFFVTDVNLKCWSFFLSLDSITMMKVKLLSTMHLRELNDAYVFTLYAIWFVCMTLCFVVFWVEWVFFYTVNIILCFCFSIYYKHLFIITAMNTNICCLFSFFIRPIKSILRWNGSLVHSKCITLRSWKRESSTK